MSFLCPSDPPSPGSADSAHCRSLPLLLGFLFLAISLFAFFAIFLFRYLHHLYRNAASRRNGRRRSAGSTYSAQSCGLDRITIATFPVYMFHAGISYCRSTPECAICLADFVDGELCRLVVSCGHEFHVSCIDQWFVQHNTCPLCRRKLDSTADVEKSLPRPDWCRRGDLISPWEDPVVVERDESEVVVEVVQSQLPSNIAGASEEGGNGGGSGASTCVTVEEATGDDGTRREQGSYNVHGNVRV